MKLKDKMKEINERNTERLTKIISLVEAKEENLSDYEKRVVKQIKEFLTKNPIPKQF